MTGKEQQDELWLDVSRTCVQNKYRSPTGPHVTAVYMVNIPLVIKLLKEKYDLIPKQSAMKSKEVLRVGEDMICPVTKQHCDDECCTVGAECNVSGDDDLISGVDVKESDAEEQYTPKQKRELITNLELKRLIERQKIIDLEKQIEIDHQRNLKFLEFFRNQQVEKYNSITNTLILLRGVK